MEAIEATRLDCPMWGKAKLGPLLRTQGFADSHATVGRIPVKLVARERIVTFGMAPDRPATGYGYIKSGEPLGDGVLAIVAFHEKPDAETARDYLAAAGYYWNAGMFLFNRQTMLDEFSASAEIRNGALAALHAARRSRTEIFLDAAAFAAVPSQPLDIAVMEKTTRGAIAPCAIGWADVGASDEVWRFSDKDDQGNALVGAVAAQNLLASGRAGSA